jgi:hypothetical protein
MTAKTTIVTTSFMLLFLVPFGIAAEPVVPARENGELVLFDADKHGLEVFSNYTASWIEGSNLVPVMRQVTKNGEKFIEISYRKEQGKAISLIRFESLPVPPTGMRYNGIRLVIDYDKDDYNYISVRSRFSDETLLISRLVLERGTNEYVISSGVRQAEYPPDWNLLSWIWLAVDTNQYGHDRNVVYRLRRITLVEEQEKKPVLGTVTFGDRVFCPEPKQIIWKEGELPARVQTHIYLSPTASARTWRTAEIFRQKYLQHSGRNLVTESFGEELPDEGIVLRIADSAVFDGSTTHLKSEGYCLVVDPQRVVITGADEPGLYYGGMTFFQLMKNSMWIEDSMPVPCVEILDWPDLPNRMCRLEHPQHFRNRELKENRGIDFLIEWTERFVAGNKLNVFFIDLSANTIYERRPEFNGSERSYTLGDLERFGEFCRDHFIDLCPAWQIGSHANWWLTLGYHPELIESGWSHYQADVMHPEHDEIVYDCMLDVIEALQPKYVSPKSDEWWQREEQDQPPVEWLRRWTRAEVFLDHHIKLNEWLKARGVTMMMFHDMITPYHNGKRFDVYKIVDEMPKDVVILHWSSPDDIPKWFARKGFTTWMNPTGVRLIPEALEPYIDGYGKGIYSFGGSTKMPCEIRNTTNMYTLYQAADHAWNLSRDQRAGWKDLVESGWLVAVRNLFAVRPNPRAGQTIRPLDIQAQMNRSFTWFLKQAKPEVYANHDRPIAMWSGMREIGFVPTQLGPEDGNNCIEIKKGDPKVSIPIAGHFSSLIFLQTAHLHSRDGIEETTYREWPYGFPCGDYIVHYEDRSESVLPLRFEYNIRRFNVPSINRATNDNRYIHTLKGADGADVHLFQWEWVNPWPNKRIVCVDVRHDNELDVSLVLLAISGRADVVSK